MCNSVHTFCFICITFHMDKSSMVIFAANLAIFGTFAQQYFPSQLNHAINMEPLELTQEL